MAHIGNAAWIAVKRAWLLVLFTSLGIALGLCAAWDRRAPHRTAAPLVLLEQPRPLPDFMLAGRTGAFTRASLLGDWWWVVFGYTNCPDVCPTTLATLATVRRQLSRSGVPPPRGLFLSVDPARDSPAQLQRYVDFFGDGFVGVTGSPAQLEHLARALGLGYRTPVAGVGAGSGYLVTHTVTIVLVDPMGREVARVATPGDAELVAATSAQAWRNSSE